jgi:drug/metabolite transporter (DMT)-like permease
VPFVLGTIGLHALYFYALGRAYATGAYSLVYPVARGLGWRWSHRGVPGVRRAPVRARRTGVALVVVGIVSLHVLPAGAAASWPGRAILWPVLTGLTIAAYSVLDKAGVARLNPVAYMLLLEAGCALLGLPLLWLRADSVRRELGSWRTIAVAAVMSALAYTLVLFAFRLSKTGYVVAARELSIVALGGDRQPLAA